ncbi:flagellar hook-associated protein FlgK [Pelobacter seleniigenes]|uniref:flagellar hook-associated protein FlgK n=1 Tax=Pelobacter seleniigenes TaxID=407188 RepID=UPI0004A75924|nr:flagellar hook-associated protein FlgK [Pelobacter seleniigenes]
MSLIASLNTGAGGLAVNQKGIEVTGNNVANINTEGYSRQSLVVSSSPTLEFQGQMIGTGAVASSVSRATNNFLAKQLTDKKSGYGEENSKGIILAEVEQIVGISTSDFSTDLDEFFDSWQELSDNPSATLERQQVMQKGAEVADSLQSMVSDLNAVSESINDDISGKVTSLNQQLNKVADLNVQILASESTGISANGLRDQRDMLLQDISETAGVTYYEEANGMVSIQLQNGQPLVTADQVSNVAAEWTNGTLQVSVDGGVSTSILDADDFGGELGGMLEMRDEYIPDLIEKLDILAYNIATSVNAVHTGGVDLDGNAGVDFFSFSAGGSDPWTGAASSIAMALTDTAQVAAGTTAAPDNQPGDNENTLNMVALQDQAVINGNNTLNDYYAVIASDVGLTVSQNEAMSDSIGDSLDQIQNMRDSVAGVSTDEEMLMLIQYQSGYEAAARYLTTVDEMLDTLMSM